jgi:hypothetical protein
MASRICHVKPIPSAAIAAPITVSLHRIFSGRIERVGELVSGMSTITGLVRFYAATAWKSVQNNKESRAPIPSFTGIRRH